MINKQNIRQVRNDINAALKAVESKHGITFSLGTIRYNSVEETLRGTLRAKSTNHVARLLNSSVLAKRVSLSEFLNKSYKVKNTIFTVIQVHPNKPKFSLECLTQTGKTYFTTSAYLLSGK